MNALSDGGSKLVSLVRKAPQEDNDADLLDENMQIAGVGGF